MLIARPILSVKSHLARHLRRMVIDAEIAELVRARPLRASTGPTEILSAPGTLLPTLIHIKRDAK